MSYFWLKALLAIGVVFGGFILLVVLAQEPCNSANEGVVRYHSVTNGGVDYICHDNHWVPKR